MCLESKVTNVKAREHACVLCPTLCNPMHYMPPGSSVHRIFQARILQWVAISSSRGSSPPRDQTHVSWVSCTGRQTLYYWVTWEVYVKARYGPNKCPLITDCLPWPNAISQRKGQSVPGFSVSAHHEINGSSTETAVCPLSPENPIGLMLYDSGCCLQGKAPSFPVCKQTTVSRKNGFEGHRIPYLALLRLSHIQIFLQALFFTTALDSQLQLLRITSQLFFFILATYN